MKKEQIKSVLENLEVFGEIKFSEEITVTHLLLIDENEVVKGSSYEVLCPSGLLVGNLEEAILDVHSELKGA